MNERQDVSPKRKHRKTPATRSQKLLPPTWSERRQMVATIQGAIKVVMMVTALCGALLTGCQVLDNQPARQHDVHTHLI